jgi:hypothetical protein
MMKFFLFPFDWFAIDTTRKVYQEKHTPGHHPACSVIAHATHQIRTRSDSDAGATQLQKARVLLRSLHREGDIA